mgnify:CR=1 FL=1
MVLEISLGFAGIFNGFLRICWDCQWISWGCAGIFNSPVAVEQLIQLSEDFMEKPNLNNLEKFMSTNGCDCYNLPYNEDFIEISQTNWKVPEKYGEVVPFLAGSNMKYKYE